MDDGIPQLDDGASPWPAAFAHLDALAQECELSARERQILHGLLAGMNNRELADGLGLKLATVKSYSSHLFRKLGVQNRLQVVILALRELLRPIGEPVPLRAGAEL
ncbi:MAG TPA: helix-turn-helix transcriptional regulator [Alphaproteobacteria bacterium]|nr:helix-turn-helix transcriptional regulator [Alphaproteobacteria bacterium]